MYEHKEKYILDFTNVKCFYDIQEILQREFDFPELYGANWDAFWDYITDLVSPKGFDIEIIGLDTIYSKYKEDIDIFIKILKRLKHIDDDEYCNVTKIAIHHGSSIVELT